MAADNSKKRTAAAAQGLLYSLIVIAILVLINFFANRYNKSIDATSTKKYTLSDQTIKIAKNLKQPLTISYWDQPSKFPAAKDLLDRYQTLSPKIDVQYMDADKKVTQAKAAGVKTYGTILVDFNGKRDEAKSLTEEEVTGAIVRAMKGGGRMACFVTGSGEHGIEDTGRNGYATLKDQLERNTYKTQAVKLLATPEIPKECTVVVVGGPRSDYLPAGVAALKKYVEDGGRALFMVDPPLKMAREEIDENAALTEVLTGWGVTPEKDLVLDLSGLGQQVGLGPEVPLVTSYDTHAIVREMKELPTAFPISRSLDVKNGDHTTVDKLFETTDASFATTNLQSAEIKESKTDKKGPLTLGAAGTYNSGKDTGNGRFVVIGSSSWCTNSFIRLAGNRDLALNTFSWLSSDEDLISIRPKEQEDRRLNMNQAQIQMVKYTSVFAIPLLIVIAGVSVWWKRR